jgi:prolyl-tRNA editing enzyme YbaK/EbsC (Cys-tRNA(Pro) deacylase)
MPTDTVPAHNPTSGLGALERWLRDEAVEHRLLEHEPTSDARHEAYAAWVPAEQAVKTLVLCDGEEAVVVAVPACERIDLHKLREELGRHRTLRLATEAEIAARFPAYEVGAVPPLGPEPVDVHVVDRRLLTYSRVLCSGGDHRHSILLDAEDLVRASHALVTDVCVARARR